jgi:deazaflavin-dependent oxidoreductase (nitroreductase family)
MSSDIDWNAHNQKVIEDFRATAGRLSGEAAGMPLVLLHHTGRKSGREFIAPLAYLRDAQDADTIYVFASKGGFPTNPDWYHNLVAAERTTVEVGPETYEVEISEVTGEKRDEIYAEQVKLLPNFGEYEEKTAGVRLIPVVALKRAA